MFKYKNVKIFTDNIEQSALQQVYALQKSGLFNDEPIRIMPDCHSGAGCVIGFTAPLADKVCPNIVGVDLNCGMLCVVLGKVNIDLKEFDKIVKEVVPSGKSVGEHSAFASEIVQNLKCYKELRNIEWVESSLGTLGGGNHFIELDKDEEGNIYLIVHSGSRNLGKQVAEIYQKKAEKYCKSKGINEIIEKLKAEGRYSEIETAIKEYKAKNPTIPKELSYIAGRDMQDYLHDVKVCGDFAMSNRIVIATNILESLGLWFLKYEKFTVLHNYIGDDGIIRKGAISAKKGERVLIPLNMRDGCIIGYGKGNKDWNNSAPHGAGRVMSRAQAKKELDVEAFKETMKNVYSTTVNESTIDEAPFAYKPSEEIIELVKETIEIEKIIKPIYNFKACE